MGQANLRWTVDHASFGRSVLTFGPRRLSQDHLRPPRRALTELTRRPVAAQRQAVQTPLRAAALTRQEDAQVQRRREEVAGGSDPRGPSGPDPLLQRQS